MPEQGSDLVALEEMLERQLGGRPSEADARELRRILSSDASARDFYVRHCEMHAMLRMEQGVFEGVASGRGNVVSLPEAAGDRPAASGTTSGRTERPAPAARQPARGKRRRVVRRIALATVSAAAGLLAAVLLELPSAVLELPGLSLFVNSSVPAPPPESSAGGPRHAVELVRETRLPDGSRVELAPKSNVLVRFEPAERSVELNSGEAHFSVAHDERRPFVVIAGAWRVRAVGTAFNVRRAAERVVVTVTEGKVEIGRAGAPAGETFGLMAGSQFLWDADQAGPMLTAVVPDSALSWRRGRLEYTSEPLRAVVADLNRYTDRPVVLRGEALGDLRFAGSILTRATDRWLTTLPKSLPVRVEVEAGAYVISDAKSPNRGPG